MGKSPFNALARISNSYTLLDKRRYAISAAVFVICILVMLMAFGTVTLAGSHVDLQSYLWGMLVSLLIAVAVHLIKWLDDTEELAKAQRHPDYSYKQTSTLDPAPHTQHTTY